MGNAEYVDLDEDDLGEESKNHLKRTMASLIHGGYHTRILAAREIGRLTRNSANNRDYFGCSGAIVPLVSMLTGHDLHSQEAALQSLRTIAFDNPRNKKEMVREEALPYVKELLESENVYLRESAARLIVTLSACDENKDEISELGVIPELVEMLSSGTVQGKVDAVMALYNLSSEPDNTSRIFESGAVMPLISLLRTWHKSTVCSEKVVCLLGSLCTFEECKEMIAEEEAIGHLVEAIEEGSEVSQESAVETLLCMCRHTKYPFKDAILRQGCMPGILQLTVDGTPKAREKATALLEMLRESPPTQSTRSSRSSSDVVQHIAKEIVSRVRDSHGIDDFSFLLSDFIRDCPPQIHDDQ